MCRYHRVGLEGGHANKKLDTGRRNARTGRQTSHGTLRHGGGKETPLLSVGRTSKRPVGGFTSSSPPTDQLGPLITYSRTRQVANCFEKKLSRRPLLPVRLSLALLFLVSYPINWTWRGGWQVVAGSSRARFVAGDEIRVPSLVSLSASNIWGCCLPLKLRIRVNRGRLVSGG